MIERLLLHRVYVGGDRFAIGMGIERSPSILPPAAEAKFRISNLAVMMAEKAVYLFSLQRTVRTSLRGSPAHILLSKDKVQWGP